MTANQITAALRLRICEAYPGSIVLRVNGMAGRTTRGHFVRSVEPGTSDLLVLLAPYGLYVAIEVKAGADRLRPAQKTFLDAVNHGGGIGIIARTVDGALEDIALRVGIRRAA